MKKLLIIKLGGSVITNKASSKPSPRLKIINNLAKEIAELYRSQKYQIILVHGAGSFGHPIAKKYSLQLGMKTLEQKLGFAETVKSMLELNSFIVNSLVLAAVPAISLPPHAFIQTSVGKLTDFDYSSVKSYLKNNQIPVLFGDPVLDNKWGCSILSGDTIISFLAQKLKADKVIFLSDVDGIYTADPKKDPKAKLIPEITNKNLKEVLNGLTPSGRDDVTGEMKGKILELLKHLRGFEIVIVNGLKSGILAKALDQHPLGTKLLLD